MDLNSYEAKINNIATELSKPNWTSNVSSLLDLPLVISYFLSINRHERQINNNILTVVCCSVTAKSEMK